MGVVQRLVAICTVPIITMYAFTGYGAICSTHTLLMYLNTWEVPCNEINVSNILVVMSELLGAVLVEKGSLASMGWVIMLYDETSKSMEGWWRDATAVGSL